MSDGSILPVIRYADPVAAADWLCSAYGFSIHHVAERPDGGAAYIVVRFGENFVLVGPYGSSAFDELMVQPADVGNRSTQSCYLTVSDVDQHFAHAQTAGAQVEVEPRDDGNGGRFYMCRDQEGHLWSFGSPLVGATLTDPARPSAVPRRDPAMGRRAATGLAALFGLAVASSAMLYLGTDWSPKALAAWIGTNGSNLLAGQGDQGRSNVFSAKRLTDAEAAARDLTEKLQISQLEIAEAQQLKRNAEKLLGASEAEYQIQLKDSQGALDAAVRAREVASQELEAERQRAQVIQTQLDEASQQLARLQADGSRFEVEVQRLRAAMAQLGDALLGSAQAAEATRGQLAAAENSEKELRERLRASGRETAELRAKVAELEADREAARVRTGQAAQAARTALAIARANQLRPRGKRPTAERGTVETPPRAIVSEPAKEAAKVPTEQAAEIARKVSTAQVSAATPRDKLPTAERGTVETPPRAIVSEPVKEAAKVPTEQAAETARAAPAAAPVSEVTPLPTSERRTAALPQHHLMQGKKWNAVGAIEKGEPQTPAAAPKPLDNGAQSACGSAVRDLVFRRRGGGALQTRVIRRLCVDSHASQEPAKCLSRLMNGRVSWGGGTDWDLKNAVDLCARTRNAATTLSCFSRKIAAKARWETAIAACSAT
jgi:uncharacterized glyoxalase superfamily protein PhnB